MNEVKYIYVCGTSFTAGTPYEKNSPVRNIIQKYSPYTLPNDVFECSWPGQLQKNVNAKVINFAVSGAGVDYLIRQTDQWLDENIEIVDKTLFLLENSSLGRMEVYSNKLNTYLICNYFYDEKSNIKCNLHEFDYLNVSKDRSEKIKQEESLLELYMNSFFDVEKYLKFWNNRMFDFICKLNYKGIKYKIFGESFLISDYHNDKIVSDNFLNLHSVKGNPISIHEFLEENRLQVKHLTNNEVPDFHASIDGNKVIAEIYLNQLRTSFLNLQ